MDFTSAPFQEQAFIGLLVSGFSVLFLWYYHSPGLRASGGQNIPLPPGPKKLPFLENMLDMPTTDAHIIFAQWAEQFDSDILHLKVAGRDYIILASYDVAIDLLDKRSGIYSSRPPVTMLHDLIGWQGDLVFMSYGNALKAHRKLLHQEFHPSRSSTHRPHEKKALRICLNSLIDSPEEWLEHIKQMIGAIIIGVAYGIQVQSKDDPNIIAASKMYSVLNAATLPGAFLVDTFPILKYVPSWFPGASFKRKAKAWYGIRNATITPPFMQVKQAMSSGTAEDSFSLRCLANAKNPDPRPDHLSEEEEMIKQTVGTLYEGGADTGQTALRTFLLAMTCFPDAQREAQAELDCVIGEGRLPDYADIESDSPVLLPYVRAVILECLRWQTVVPLAVPHQVDTDDIYRGYYIPKGATVLPNVWGILRDKKRYGPTAHTFDPKRWLSRAFNEEGKAQWKLNPAMMIHDPIPMSFGFGRRVCPGQHMALSTFQITVTSLLHSFDIMPPMGEDGNPIVPEIKYISKLTSGPAPFKCSIKPRSPKHVTLVRQALLEIEV